jgi:hypothetical protein
MISKGCHGYYYMLQDAATGLALAHHVLLICMRQPNKQILSLLQYIHISHLGTEVETQLTDVVTMKSCFGQKCGEAS